MNAFQLSFFKNINRSIKIQLKDTKHPFFIRSSTSDIAVLNQIFVYQDYEINLPFYPENIIDCGANIGLSVVYFKNRYPDSTIIALEPEDSNFELLKKNTEAYTNIFTLQEGLWNHECSLEIMEGPDKKPWSFYLVPTTTEKDKNIVRATGINELMFKYNLKGIDLLKIDIEGAEKELFERNYEDWLPKVKVIVIELHDRFKPLSSKNFLHAISRFDFNIELKGENIIAFNMNFNAQDSLTIFE